LKTFLPSIVVAFGLVSVPAVASASASHADAGLAAGAHGAATAPALPSNERAVCPAARPGQMQCMSVLQLPGSGQNTPAFTSAAAAAVAAVSGYHPSDLRSAYGLAHASATKGAGRTIAIVDAFRDPNAASDLARYRSHFGLPACKLASGCLRILNQNGKKGPLPRANASWAIEESLDLDMVSAICPKCHILLVEANSTSSTSLGIAERTAASRARYVSNSWGGPEFNGEATLNHYFNHPGDAIVFSSGDSGYGTAYPAALQYVTSVGGTALRHTPSGSRAWTETAWGASSSTADGTGSGCSAHLAKPSWQRKPVDISAHGCLRRTMNDVSAVADPATGVAVFDTYRTGGTWGVVGGTSASAPIITATYALAGVPARRSYPASYPYQHPAQFHDVKSGVNGSCSARPYLCHGENGFDGPTGIGTPSGAFGFSHSGTDPVTLVDPGAQSARHSHSFSLKIVGLDTRATTSVVFWATGLPAGLSIRHLAGGTSGLIHGTISHFAAGKVFHVVVHGKDTKTHRVGTTRFTLTVH
jgi:hypothetical protein